MIKAHVISDLALHEAEWANPIDETLPDCDLVFINGNNGILRRSMVFAEAICKKYPHVQVVYLNGRQELVRQKERTIISNGLITRKHFSELWPTNLHYDFEKPISLTINNITLDILCLHGYPLIEKDINTDLWKSSDWYRYVTHGLTSDPDYCRPQGISNASRGEYPVWSSPELCRIDHDKEYAIVNDWCNHREKDTVKILATSLSPINDASLPKIDYTLYPNITPDYWLVSGHRVDIQTPSYRLYGNPGAGALARSNVLTIDI